MFPMHSEVHSDEDFSFVKMETQGWRPSQEDFILSQEIVGLNHNSVKDYIFAVFDGHGGNYISLLCKNVLPILL